MYKKSFCDSLKSISHGSESFIQTVFGFCNIYVVKSNRFWTPLKFQLNMPNCINEINNELF